VGRLAALLVLGGALVAYYATADGLWQASLWWDVAWLAFVVIPAVFALVWLALPLWSARGLLPVGVALALLAFACDRAGLDIAADYSKLAAMTFVAWWFLSYFEELSWVVLVALVIPWVDAYSVWRGPTKVIVTKHAHVFTSFSFAFPIPGESASANLGLPDLLFFSLFLAAAARFLLRTNLTWVLMTLSFGGTLALAVWRKLGGLPALPLLSLGFLLANGDLIWTQLRRDRGSR
jgi:hypothetical protein